MITSNSIQYFIYLKNKMTDFKLLCYKWVNYSGRDVYSCLEIKKCICVSNLT